MTDKEFFINNGFSLYNGEMSKIFLESALRVFVAMDWEGFNVKYVAGVLHNGALFDGTIIISALTREDAIAEIEEFAKRMKI